MQAIDSGDCLELKLTAKLARKRILKLGSDNGAEIGEIHPVMNTTKSPSAAMREYNASNQAIVIRYKDFEFIVKPRGDKNDARAYFTNDIADAIATANAMQTRLFPGL